eukprot:s430_g18.t1
MVSSCAPCGCADPVTKQLLVHTCLEEFRNQEPSCLLESCFALAANPSGSVGVVHTLPEHWSLCSQVPLEILPRASPKAEGLSPETLVHQTDAPATATWNTRPQPPRALKDFNACEPRRCCPERAKWSGKGRGGAWLIDR